ncbi:MAG: hypothetical protein E7773_10205 [Sphingomonas sp.]|uniref:hypothetical protein n=1 Tax=Sphingomonas sp. TaxID=28214 RepID=UPI0012200E82|nr:hypothetical protein [Sphingomonas sp.]THD35710.1 MAG: hypothetical protein E7773_10205 [Sphingomonas sp.]
MIGIDNSALGSFVIELEGALADEALRVMSGIFTDLTAPPPVGTPVDTGVARNGWQLDLSQPLAPEVYNDVVYINALNNGHSQQAPAGFIEAAIDKNVR